MTSLSDWIGTYALDVVAAIVLLLIAAVIGSYLWFHTHQITARPLPRRDVQHYQDLAREAQAENDRAFLDATGRWVR